MKICISGICGFVGSVLARALKDYEPEWNCWGVDSLVRPGSETNRQALRHLGIEVRHADIRLASDVDSLPSADWVVDAAALPSVLAGIDGQSNPRQLVEHNLFGTVNLLESCRRHRAGFILVSTNRVYSIAHLASVPVQVHESAFVLDASGRLPAGVTVNGINEQASTDPPVSLYGASKLASERLALEFGETFQFPVWINRCGVLAGAGQFGHPEQGIFSYWINAYIRRQPLRYIGFGGQGHQVRDVLHPRDLSRLVRDQVKASGAGKPRLLNLGGGLRNSLSLAQLTAWCQARFGAHPIQRDERPRPFDLPWLVMDSSAAHQHWSWQPEISWESILNEIAQHAEAHPEWLQLSRTG